MNQRRGLGKNLGQGYRNIAPQDHHVHALSAKGVSTQQKYFSVLNAENLGEQPTQEKKNVLKLIAEKAASGVQSAVKWEKEHLPSQQAWVKEHYESVKNAAQKEVEKIRADMEKKKEASEFAEGVVPYYDEKDTPEQMAEEADVVEDMPEPSEAPKPSQPGFFTNAGTFVKTKYGELQETIKAKKLEEAELRHLSDASVYKLAIQEDGNLGLGSFFGSGSGNKYKDELFRREQEKIDIARRLREIRSGKDKSGSGDNFFKEMFSDKPISKM